MRRVDANFVGVTGTRGATPLGVRRVSAFFGLGPAGVAVGFDVRTNLVFAAELAFTITGDGAFRTIFGFSFIAFVTAFAVGSFLCEFTGLAFLTALCADVSGI